MLELSNFGLVATPIISFVSCDKILLVTSWTETMTLYNLCFEILLF